MEKQFFVATCIEQARDLTKPAEADLSINKEAVEPLPDRLLVLAGGGENNVCW
jgi:hypothetical protein